MDVPSEFGLNPDPADVEAARRAADEAPQTELMNKCGSFKYLGSIFLESFPQKPPHHPLIAPGLLLEVELSNDQPECIVVIFAASVRWHFGEED